jgi:hypothetical protein
MQQPDMQGPDMPAIDMWEPAMPAIAPVNRSFSPR